MENLERIKEKVASRKTELKSKFNVKEIGIFGSYVRGEQKKKSDIDILVSFQKPVGMFTFIDLENYLSRLLDAKVDLVSKKALKPRIGARILNEAVFV